MTLKTRIANWLTNGRYGSLLHDLRIAVTAARFVLGFHENHGSKR